MNQYDASKYSADQAMRGELEGWLHDNTDEVGDCMVWARGYSNSGKTPSMVMPQALPAKPGSARRVTVSSVVWEQANRKRVPPGSAVWAMCGVVGCVHPKHLTCTTRPKMNAGHAKMGRHKRSIATREKILRTRQAISPLSISDVVSIREALADVPSQQGGKFLRRGEKADGRMAAMKAQAEKYGVSFSSIKRIVSFTSWKTPNQIGMFSQLLAANDNQTKRRA